LRLETLSTRRPIIQRAFRMTPLLLALWWVLSDGAPSGWIFGLLAVAVAAGAVLSTAPLSTAAPQDTWRWAAFPAFAWYFVGRSLLAGLDVARRTLSPSLPLSPAIVRVATELPTERARVFLMATLCLLPGSLGVDLDEHIMTLHILDAPDNIEEDVRTAERFIGPLFAPRPAGPAQ
jgi:multicomponent Na+:H+ antiporter subunit E